MFDTTIIFISYRSEKLILNQIKKLPKFIPIIIIDNSNSFLMKEHIKKEYPNINIFVRENNGVSSALNFAVEKVKTKYFLQINPDIEFKYGDLNIFLELARELDNKFAAIGPRFLNVKKKGHKQISDKIEFGSIDSIHGSCMFINKECFNKIGGFDENYFLYFEETDYCYRGKKLGYKSYQINKSKVQSQGRSVDLSGDNDKISNILNWHFIWSKFYFNKKKYGKSISLLIFLPIIIRIIFKIFLNKLIKDDKQLQKYKIRYNGLINSIKGYKSNLRP
jgi:N-acetylglucosaminyl-diphospho-decaprenol L-rhamnosyltransferase